MTATIAGISSMATRPMLADVAAAWRRLSACDATFVSVGGVDAARRVAAGESFDVVVLAADAIDALVASGHVFARNDLARSRVAVAVKQGAARPSIGSEAALRDAVLSARSIGYSTGPSGVALAGQFERWGIAEAIGPRLVQAPPGVPVGTLVARGDVELGFQQLSELMHVQGIDVIGALPSSVAIVTTFSAGIGAACARREAARAFIEFVRSPACDEAIRRHGMEPARSGASPAQEETR